MLQVQMLPKAALLLATAPSSEKRDKVMRYLPVWAPGTGMAPFIGTTHLLQGMKVQFTPPKPLGSPAVLL